MAETRPLTPRNGDVVLLVGTTKGAFMLRSNAARTKWQVGGPHFQGQAIYALALDQRGGRRRLLAGGGHDHFGPIFHISDDFGRTWSLPEQIPMKFPEDTDTALKRVWQIVPGRESEPDTLYCGVEPAALFESRDAGNSWSLVRGLWDHEQRPRWQPGGGGLCLHTVIPDPVHRDRIFVAISTAGVYRTDDGGASWSPRNHGVRAEFLPDKDPEYGQCVHKIVQHPTVPERLFLQNHWGLYRTEDAGDSWQDIANGVPSDFGFAMTVHPHDPETVYIVPLESDGFRVTPDARLRVYRTRNAGASWEALTRGLPQEHAMETVLRDAMDADDLNPAGIYFGTRSGKVFGSANGGAAWTTVIDGLPPVICVKAVVIGNPAKVRVPRPAAAAKRTVRRAAPKRAAKHAAPKRAAKRAAPKRTAKRAAPKRAARSAAPKRAPKRAAPKRAGSKRASARAGTRRR